MPIWSLFWIKITTLFNDKIMLVYLGMKKPERRDTLTIMSDLLQGMKEPRRITHLLYATNLSYSQLVKYLKIVKEMGLAQEQKKPFQSYILTNDGQLFMDMVHKRQE